MDHRRTVALLVGLSIVVPTLTLLGFNARAVTSVNLYGRTSPAAWSQSPDFSNTNPTIEINASTDYTFYLHATDGIGHTFLVDLNTNGAKDPGEPYQDTFTNNVPPVSFIVNVPNAGSYPFKCTIHPDMKGTLTVVGGSTTPTIAGISLYIVLGIVIAIIVVLAIVAVVMMRRRGPPK